MLASFAQWCQTLALAEAIRDKSWPFPTIEIFHLAGLVLVFGSILVLNLRLFGFILKDVSAVDMAMSLAPWTLAGLGVQVLTGPLLFISGAMRFSQNEEFRIKMVLIACALLYHFGIHRRAASAGAMAARVSAAVSMLLWVGVFLAGMGIELLA